MTNAVETRPDAETTPLDPPPLDPDSVAWSVFGDLTFVLGASRRLLIDVAVVLVWHAGRLPWAALLIPARDVALIAATPLVVGRGYRFEVNLLGKVATWALYASLALVLVTSRGTDWPVAIFWAGFGLAAASLVLYARKARREVRA